MYLKKLHLLPLWKLVDPLSVTVNPHFLKNLYGKPIFLFFFFPIFYILSIDR